MSKQTFKVCFCFRRIFKFRVPEPMEDIKQLFERYSKNGTMTIEDLQRFLIEYQKEDNGTKEERAQAIFNSLKHLNIFQRKGLHLEAFFRYLLSDINSPLFPLEVHQDMNCPLSHYFLYTGHNSYLTGNQLTSDSSVDPIIKALKRGVRVIELDLWPNATKDGISVCHGGTLTAPVSLNKCLLAIKEYAFHASEYPLVITFEDHLDPNLQAKVAEMVTKIIGDMLYYCTDSEYLEQFPSPKSLKRKIMISTKPPKENLGTQSNIERGNSKKVKDSLEEEHLDNLDEREYHQVEDVENKIPEYKRLICIHARKVKGRLEYSLSIDPNKVSRLSLSEQELEDVAKTHGTDIVRFTQQNLLRVYPKGMRFNSSNYNPLRAWGHGAQMVAFNMQGYGKHLWTMHGMFRANGGCGYVKKPDFLLKADEIFDPNDSLPVKKILKVKVYMGEGWHSDFRSTHFDTCSPPDFFAKVAIAGVPADEKKKQTKTIEDQWIPVWNEEFEFPLTTPELALLRIVVREYDPSGKNDFGGQTCLPVSELRSGIRAVPLHDEKGEKYKSVKLLIRFEFSLPK